MAIKLTELVGKTWFDSLVLCIADIRELYFSLGNVYQYEQILSEAYPKNNNVKDKIRQTLQYLRKAGLIEFLNDKGNYRLLDLSLLNEFKLDLKRFNVSETALPNYPLHELKQKPQLDLQGQPKSKSQKDRSNDAALGEAGEQVILFREKEFLRKSGRDDLAERTEQVSKTKGDHIGYDIISYKLTGEEKWIEVKTTKGHHSTKFHISENQISTSESCPEKYQLHRLYDFDAESHTSSLYIVYGDLRSQLFLEPTNYRGHVNL